MKSKRIFTLMLALVMTLSLAACGGSKQEEAPADNAGNGEAAGDTQDFGGAELVVATWGWAEAGLKALAADFESKYNCTIVVDPTSGNGDRLNKLMAEQNDPTADVALLTKSFARLAMMRACLRRSPPTSSPASAICMPSLSTPTATAPATPCAATASCTMPTLWRRPVCPPPPPTRVCLMTSMRTWWLCPT